MSISQKFLLKIYPLERLRNASFLCDVTTLLSVLQPTGFLFTLLIFFEMSQNTQKLVQAHTTPTHTANAYHSETEQAIATFLEESTFDEARTHLLDVMCFLTADYDFSDFTPDLKQKVWWNTRYLYALLTQLQAAVTTKKEVSND